MSEAQDAGSGAVAEAKAAMPDPRSMPLSELGSVINAHPEDARLGIVDEDAAPEVQETPAEVQEEVEAVEETEVEAAPEDDAVESEEASEQPEQDAPQIDPDLEILQRQVAKLERTLSSREGKYGNQQQIIQRLENENAQLRARVDNGDIGLDEDTSRSEPTPRRDESGALAFLQKQAQQNALSSFINSHPDLVGDSGVDPAFVEHVRAASRNASLSDDPNLIQQEVRDVLSNAYDDFRVEQLRKQRESKRVDQASSLKKKKRAASLSASSGRPAPKKTTLPDPRTMSMDDLKKSIETGLAG